MMPLATVKSFDGANEIRRSVQRDMLLALWRATFQWLTQMPAAYAKRRRLRRSVAELNALSDRMLKDIGIARFDIPRLAGGGRDGSERGR